MDLCVQVECKESPSLNGEDATDSCVYMSHPIAPCSHTVGSRNLCADGIYPRTSFVDMSQ